MALLGELGLGDPAGAGRGLPADGLDSGDVEWVHAVLECQKLAFADREAWYGDPDATDVPIRALLATSYTRDRAALVDHRPADPRLRPGSPDGRVPRLPLLPDYHPDGRPRTGVRREPPADHVDGGCWTSGPPPRDRPRIP